ncbi:DNA-binding protein RFXANK isoform X3 [Denticeps clupeoides]|uniref:Transmembrane protein 221 n=1 Tax=Denticeps clupeoides TaxID=299321 RepID=A0AAY4EDW8_9TELE|nr:DNA-binding protein RFXANK isoform X3 [Denticeps clupeoides]
MTPAAYAQGCSAALALLGLLSAVMSLLSAALVFQLRAEQAAMKASAAVPAEASLVLAPVSAVLAALSLVLSLSSAAACLLHSYFAADVCGGDGDTRGADWFLLDSRAVRHVAVGLFCVGVSVYLAAMSIYMLLVFEIETGIASVCVLSSGVLVLLIIVVHSRVRAAQAARRCRSERMPTTYKNEHEINPRVHQPETRHRDQFRRQGSQSSMRRQLPYPAGAEPRQQQPPPPPLSPLAEWQSRASERESYRPSGSVPRMHRTLSAESGMLQVPSKPWNGVNSEMRTVLARKAGVIGKDSTLV